MNSAEPITPQELLELASLDALGLLDEFEAEVYTRAFHDSPATVQDEILRLQSEVASDPTLLPGQEPDPKLRERVLKAVADAIARQDAPIARIGRPKREHDGTRRFFNSPTTFWRAASFVMAGASLIMAYFLAIGYQSSHELAQAFFNADAGKLEVLMSQQVGQQAKNFLLDESEKIALDPVTPGNVYNAALYVNEDREQVMILVDGLPFSDDREYVLQIQKKDGGTEEVLAFDSHEGMNAVLVKNVAANVLANALRWEIATVAGEVLLRSA